jgi:hypothetical protein
MMVKLAALLALFLLVSPGLSVQVSSGVSRTTPPGYNLSNIDSNLNSSTNNEIYDANFIPGFQAGLTNTSVYWSSGPGRGDVGYWIGPWSRDESGLPHLAVGPQCCNFVEVNHTQQFRKPSWGDFYFVKAGLGPPGVNVQNFTSDFRAPADVGLRTDWNWSVQFSLDWKAPSLLDPSNEWAAIGVAATQYVPSAPGNLVYSVVNFWMDRNSSSELTDYPDGTARLVEPSVVVYHPIQLSTEGNQTITLDLSAYLADTMRTLGLSSSAGSAVISYVYLNVEGYNLRWNSTLWSFKVMYSSPAPSHPSNLLYIALAAVGATGVVLLSYFLVTRQSRGPRASSRPPQRGG